MTGEAYDQKDASSYEDEEEYEHRKVMGVGESEGEEESEAKETVIFFLECTQEKDKDERNKEISHDVTDDASGDELGLRRSEGVERSTQEEEGKSCEFRSEQLSDRGCLHDSVGEDG